MEQINPTIEQAYHDHMKTRRGRREPLYPPTVLARAAGGDGVAAEPARDPLVYGPILRDSLQAHIASFSNDFGVDVRPVLAASFLVNLLTEDNLPYYTHKNLGVARSNEVLQTWVREWTAEEDAHGVLMRDYALLSGLIGDAGVIDHATYHAGRAQQLRSGTEIDPPTNFDALAYLTLQEHLTKEAHNALGWLLDRRGRSVLRPIGGDEHNHFEFYLALSRAALAVDPDVTIIAMRDVYRSFDMPGKVGIPGFTDLATTIGLSGVFDLATIARSMQRIAVKLDIPDVRPTTDWGQRAQTELVELTDDSGVERRQRLMESLRAGVSTAPGDDGLRTFVLGATIDFQRVDTGAGSRIVGLQAIP